MESHIPALLAWYTAHDRQLPWRVRKGRANPYHVWLSEIMLQQTTSAAVAPYYEKFLALWPTVQALAAAEQNAVLAAWAGLGYYARARNLHACAQVVVQQYQGQFPLYYDDLLKLPGIGAYTAAAIATICAGQRVAVVDGNVMRVIARVFALDRLKPKLEHEVRARLTPLIPSDPAAFAQALMDLGNQVCTPRNPKCEVCPMQPACAAFSAKTQELYPIKSIKKSKETRNIAIFAVIRNNTEILLRQRTEKGLLANMIEIPSAGWQNGYEANTSHALNDAPFRLPYQLLPTSYTHVFTHFTAHVHVWLAHVGSTIDAPSDMWFDSLTTAHTHALPSIMKKGLEIVITHKNNIVSPTPCG